MIKLNANAGPVRFFLKAWEGRRKVVGEKPIAFVLWACTTSLNSTRVVSTQSCRTILHNNLAGLAHNHPG